MTKYVVKRLLLLIPTLLLILIIVFTMLNIIPGTAVDVVYYRMTTSGADVDRDAVEHMMGLDIPPVRRFLNWMRDMLRGDLGTSYYRYDEVKAILKREIPISMQLGLLTLIAANLISIPVGLLCAARQDSIGDYITRIVAILMMSIPMFWIATLVLIYPAKWWGYAPNIKYYPFFQNPGKFISMFLPAVILGALSQAGMQLRTVRTVVLDTLRQDYVRTARAKGIRERRVLYLHAFRNAMIPVVTTIGHSVAGIIGGSVIMENIFNIPGVGSELIQALSTRDYPVIMGCVLVFSVFVMVVNALVDICYKWIDPRITLD